MSPTENYRLVDAGIRTNLLNGRYIKTNVQATFNVAVEEEQRDFAAHYYYEYQEEREERMEEIRIKKIQDRLERQRQLESTLKYKFQSMPKEDQWALIGGGVSIIVLIMLGEDHQSS